MALTALAIRQAKAGEKAIKLFDGQGLFLHIAPSGTKSWRMKYRFGPKEKLLTFGRFPEVSLTEARERRDAARVHLRANRDPGIEAERDRMAAIEAAGARFEVTARAWHDDERPRWTPQYARVVMNALTRDVFPDLGNVPIADITGPMILRTVRKIERRGSIETAKRVLTYISAVFVRAKGEHLVSGNPTENLIDALKPTPKGSKQPALTTLADLHTLQRVVEGSTSGPAIKLASRLLAMTAVRIGVLRTALWKEFEGIEWEADTPSPKAVWRIPAERMKLDMENKGDEAFDHDVPLPAPAVEALRALHLLTGRGRLLFPGQRSARVPMSDAATSTLYKRMDGGRYKGRHVPHGWRSAFSTIMNEWAMEHGKEGDRMLIDLMLAHKPSGVSGSEFAYMRAKFAARRRVLAGVWADMIAGGLDDPMTIVADQAR